MRPYLLWRLTGAPSESVTQPERLAEGLALHLRYADLLTLLVQIGERQQAYLALHGGATCAQTHCAPGCPTQLLRRLLTACIAGAALHPATSGLARRPYQRVAVALPTTVAQPLDATLLHIWDEARLQLRWRQGRRGLCCAALLAVGADGPDPASVLQSHGWQPRPLEAWWARRTLQTPLPQLWAIPRQTQLAPALMLPIPPEQSSSEQHASADTVPGGMLSDQLRALLSDQPGPDGHAATGPDVALDDAALAGWLVAAQQLTPRPADDTAPAPPAPIDDTEAGVWPAGPGGLTPQAVGQLLRQLVTHPAFTQGAQASQIGVVKGRLVKVLGVAEPVALALLVWLDMAELLAAPVHPDDRWRRPRPLVTTDLDVLASRLAATPLPTPQDLQAATGVAP